MMETKVEEHPCSAAADDVRIIAFCCHYCAFTAADLAGTMRQQYPPNIRIVRLPCTGRLEVNMILQAFVDGADGVLVAGCEPGGCHFIKGNLRARKRVDYTRKLLSEAGIDPDRLEMYYIAASEGPLFAQTSREFTEKIQQLKRQRAGGDGTSQSMNGDGT
jgi:coenzyme F420-reducing hydrogenase delta subunit